MRFMGTNPSGQNMTVYINSIVNSLLHRLAFNDTFDVERRAEIGAELGLGRPARFRDLVNLMTYGDDAMGSVLEGYDEFNHVSMANFLAANGMQFTMPDKTSEPRPFMNVFEVDFLKRKIAFNPDLDVFVGQLDENSIFKSLHSILKSKAVEPMEVARMNMEGALREWFFYGEKHFEMRREQMSKIAKKCRLTSDALGKDYWERVEEWKLKYQPQAGVIETPEILDITDKNHPIYGGEKVHKNVRKRVAELISEPESVLRDLYNLSTIMSTITARITARACEYILDYRGCVPVDVWNYSDDSVSTIEDPEPVPNENELIDEVKAILGKPTAEEYVVVAPQFGKGDLLYVNGNTIMVIECKRVIGRPNHFAQKVVDQAKKYGAVVRALKPDHTVYSLTYTEFGFQIVDVQGDLTFPERFAHVLDNADIRWI